MRTDSEIGQIDARVPKNRQKSRRAPAYGDTGIPDGLIKEPGVDFLRAHRRCISSAGGEASDYSRCFSIPPLPRRNSGQMAILESGMFDTNIWIKSLARSLVAVVRQIDSYA